MDIIQIARDVFEIEKQSIKEAALGLNDNFVRLVNDIRSCDGRVIIVGMGKCSHIGAKIAATMSSLGTPTYFLHPAESLHGDLGRVTFSDIVIFFSKSGESEELNKMMPSVKQIGANTVAVTCRSSSTLSRSCNYHIKLNITQEACIYNIAPTSSTTVMMVFGDALAVCLEKLSGFTPDDLAIFHPSGALGKRLLFKVEDLMAKGDEMPFVSHTATINDAIVEMCSKVVVGGVAILGSDCELLGIFTDGDLRRTLKSSHDASVFTKRITEVMTTNPIVLTKDMKAMDALSIMSNPEKTINLLPIVDNDKKLIGMLSIHDLIKAGL